MDKIVVYESVTLSPYGITENFLDGLHYSERFTEFYNLLKELNIEGIEVLPSFPYVDYRQTNEETMKVFYIKSKVLTIDEIIDLLSSKELNIKFSFNEDKQAIQITLL